MRKLAVLFFVALLCSCKEGEHQYNGYVDADLTYLSSNFAGRLANLLVIRGQHVDKNKLLFKLEQTNEHFGVSISQLNNKNLLTQRSVIINQIQYSEINYRRTLNMVKQHAASQNDLDVAKKELDVLRDQLKGINVQIQGSQVETSDKKWQLQRKEANATDSGIIFDTYFTKDEYVQAGQPVLSLLTQKNIKVVFFVSETRLSNILLNSKVTISSDGNPNLATGTINYISNIAQYTPPIIYSREDRQELVFRVEASLDNANLNEVHLGQPVSLELVR
jgi:HlyD family secretion protein